MNPSQTPIDTCDQPVWTLTKELQWRRLLEFENYFPLFAGILHIEPSMQNAHGDIIRSSSLPEVLKISNHSITSTDAAIKTNHLKSVRYCIQVHFTKKLKKHT